MDEGVAAVVASAVTGGTAVAVGGLTYLATRLQSRTEHMLWRSQSRLETYVKWLDLAGTAHDTALRALNAIDDDVAEATAVARAGRQSGEELLELVLTLDLHGPAYLADQFRYHGATVVLLFDDIASLSSPVTEETLDGLVAKHTECGMRLHSLREEAREALDSPTRRRERFLTRLTPEAWRRLNR
ncbi:hypothetical protein ABZ553_14750 [Streptomyces sparsogenes]|uniref:hypothetical protein n=1 Tax=Streptomyces sparsogenes TaxID=67365 RepID=UPI0033D26D1C